MLGRLVGIFAVGKLQKNIGMSLGDLTKVSDDSSDKEPLRVFGDLYSDARRAQGRTLKEISTLTKINIHFLEALEKDEIDKLPTAVFTRSFVRSYAEALSLDPSYVLDEYVKRFPTFSRKATFGQAKVLADDSTFLSEQKMARTLVILLILSVPLIALLVVVGLAR